MSDQDNTKHTEPGKLKSQIDDKDILAELGLTDDDQNDTQSSTETPAVTTPSETDNDSTSDAHGETDPSSIQDIGATAVDKVNETASDTAEPDPQPPVTYEVPDEKGPDGGPQPSATQSPEKATDKTESSYTADREPAAAAPHLRKLFGFFPGSYRFKLYTAIVLLGLIVTSVTLLCLSVLTKHPTKLPDDGSLRSKTTHNPISAGFSTPASYNNSPFQTGTPSEPDDPSRLTMCEFIVPITSNSTKHTIYTFTISAACSTPPGKIEKPSITALRYAIYNRLSVARTGDIMNIEQRRILSDDIKKIINTTLQRDIVTSVTFDNVQGS